MQKRKSFFNNEMEQRFSLRKYTIGLCSVCLGFVVIGMGSQTVKADTVNDVEKSSAVQENKTQDVDSANTDALAESKTNTSDSAAANPNTAPTKTKEDKTGSVATTASKTNTTSNGVNANPADLEKTGALTTADQTSPKENVPTANEASKANEAAIAEPVKQDSVANGKSDGPEQVHLQLRQKPGFAASQAVLRVKNKAPLANLAENKVANNTGVTTPAQQDGAANEKLIGTGKKASVSLSDGSTLTISNNVLDDQNTSAILTFQSGNFKAGDTYQIKVPKKGHLRLDKVDVASLQPGMGTTTFDDSDENYWVITDNFTNTGTVKQDIKINRYEDNYRLEDYIRNIYHNSIQLSKNSKEKANLNIDEIDKTYGLKVVPQGSYDHSGADGALLFNNDENKIASYTVDLYGRNSDKLFLYLNDKIRIINTIENLDWAIPDKVLVNGEESKFTYDNNKLTVYINPSDNDTDYKIDVMGNVNVNPDKFDSHHKWNIENVVGVQAQINNVEQNNSDTIKNIVIDSVQNLTVGDMFQIERSYTAGYYDNQYPIPIIDGEYSVNDGYSNNHSAYDTQGAIRDSGIIDIQNVTGKTLDNVSVDADIPDGIDLTNVEFQTNIDPTEQEKVDIKTIISYTDGSSDIFNTSELEQFNDVLNPNNNKKIKHIKLELNKFNSASQIKLRSARSVNLSSVQKENTRIAEKYADGTPVAPGDLITFKETISAYGQKGTIDTSYLRLIDHSHDKYNLDLYLLSNQSNKSPNIQDAGNVEYIIKGIKKGDSPVVYIRVPKNATLTGDKSLFRTTDIINDNKSINYQLLHIGDSVFMKVQLPKNTSGSATLTVPYGTIPDGQTSEDQLAYAVSGIDTDSYNHEHDNNAIFADDGNIEYGNSSEISNAFNALFKQESIDLKDVAYYYHDIAIKTVFDKDNPVRQATINNPTWDVLTSEGISTISMTDSNMNPMPNMDSTQNVHGEHPDTFNIYGSIINATDQTIKGATQVINVPDSSDGKSQFNPVLNGPIHLIDALTGNDLSGLVEITYSTQKSDLSDPESTISGVSADQVTDWSQIKSVQVHFKNNSLPGKTSARAVLTLKDPHIYDDIGKTIYASNKTFTKDQQTGEFELLPTVIKPGSTNSAKLTVAGQAKVHTLIHYGDQYIELPDKLKTYAELNDMMQRSDFLSSDTDLTYQDRALLPANIAIDYAHPTIKNSDETYVDGYKNGLAEFGKQAKYDFNNDSVVFNAQDMKLVTDNKDITETIHYVYKDGPKKGQKAAEDTVNTVTFTKIGYQNPFTGETKWANNTETKEFKAVDSPTITNYTPDSETIDAITVNQNSDNIVKTVSYKANCSNLHVIYQDDTDHQELSHKDFLNGIIGDSVNYNTNDTISNYQNQHYDLVSDETNGQNLTYQDTDKTYVIHFKHHISNVDETSKSTQTVHYVASDNSVVPSDAKHEVSYSRTNQHDDVTGKITNYGTWGPMKTLPDVQTPEKKGYTPDIKEVQGATTTPGKSEDFKTTVTYTPDKQKAKVVFIDDTDHQTLKTVNKDGVTKGDSGYSTRQDIQNYENQHYVLVSDTSDGSELIFDDDDLTDQYYEVHLKHKTESVTRNDTVTRTIHYLYDNGNTAQSDKTQTVSFNETGTKDDVTGKTTWSNDNAQSVDSVDTPNIVGYTPDKSFIEGQSFKFGDKDVEVTVTYNANAQTATITYIDDTTKTNLDSKDTSGKFGQAITFATAPADEIENYKKQGYVLVSSTFDNNKYQADNSNNVFYVHLKHGTSESSRKDDVNMTVHYVMDDGSKAPSDSKQTVSFTESGIKDNVTGNITWTPATSQTLKDVDSPLLTGYTADIKTANGKVVNFGDPDINVTVHYSANAQTATITYIDDTEKKTLGSDKQNGKFNQVITFEHDPAEVIKGLEEKGYALVSNDFNSNKYQADNGNNVFYVHLKHGTKKVSQEHSASFTVHYIYKDGRQAKPDHEQTLSFTENGIQDLVTQKITWTPADSQKFDDVVTPVITGYTPDQNEVIGQTANFETGDRKVTVTYLPDVQLGHINYIDDDTKKTLTRDDFSGRTNEHEDYTSTDRIQEFENKGYELVSNDYPDGGFNFDNNDRQDQVFNVHLKHGTVTVTTENPQTPNTPINPDPQSPKYPKDISNTNSDVKRTIDYKFKDGKTAQPTVNDSLHFERTVVIDKVTGDVVSDTWTQSQDFNDIQTPAIQGYTPDRTVVSDKNIGHDHQDIIERVVYSPDAQHMTITYIDDTTGKTLHTDNPNGVSDQDANYTTSDTIKKYEDQHYKLVSDSTKGQDLVFDHDDKVDQTYEVHFVHGEHAIDQTTSPKQTIHYVYANGLARQGKAIDDNVQQLSFKRDGYNDEVTGIDHWNAWTPVNSNYNAVDSPVIQGYTPDKLIVEKSTVNPTDKDIEVTVTYNADKQAAHVIYIDKTTNTTLASKDLSGKSDEDSEYNTGDKIGKYKSQHYVLFEDETNGKNVIFDHNDKQDQTYYVYFVHDTQKVNRKDTVTSTIDYKFEDGKTAQPTVTQTKHFSEDGIKDLVTDKITWTPADSQTFENVVTPKMTGYTPDKDNVAGQTVKFGDSDINVTVHYIANAQKAKITYIDDTTKTNLDSKDANGKFGQTITFATAPTNEIANYEKKGYVLVSNSFDNQKYQANDNNNVFEVHLKHGNITVTTKKPQTPNTPINPDPQSPKYPKDISNTNSDVKRTIDYKFKDGKTAQPTVNDSLHFERTVVIDKVTGDVVSDTWTQSQDFNDIQTPAIQGYTPDRTVVSDKNIGHDHQDIIERVVYSPDAQHMTITYIDDTTGKTLHTDKPNGVSDQDANYTTSDTIKQYEDQHYKLVSDSTHGQNLIFDHDDKVDQTYEVHFVHDTQKVNRQDTVTSTIDYKFEDGKTAQPTVTQTKHFSENGIKDLITGKITWDEATPQKFEDVATKSIVGYTPDKDNVVGGTVKFGDKDVEVTVTYHNNAQTAKITYIDDTEKKTLGSDQQNGKFDHEITFEHDPAEVIKGLEEKGYKLVSDNFKPGIKYQNDNKFNNFEVHLVHTYEPVETSQTITETVHYIDANGKPVAPDHVATVVIKVTGTRDKVTDSITWNTPSTGHFDEVISPEVPNMTPDKKFIPSRNVQYGDSDITENVVYTSDETSREPEKPNDQGKPNSKTPEKPNKSGNPTSKNSEKSNESSKEVSKQFGTIAKTTIPEKPINSRTVDNHVSAKSTTKRELPQTGTTANTGIWTGLVSIITSLGLLGASKKRKKN